MKRKKLTAFLSVVMALAGSAFLSDAFADTASSSSLGWVLLPNSVGPDTGTWALPANLNSIGCGTENETSCEPTGTFIVSNPFTISGPGYYTIMEGTAISDIITVANVGGQGQIEFLSDPNPGSATPPVGFANLGSLCNENTGNGCVGSFNLTTTSGAILTVQAGSDVESAFDPFGFGFDSSDQIKFTGVTPISSPEPSSLALLLSGLALMAYGGRRAPR